GVVQALDPRTIRASADSTANEQFATYRVAAWDVGTQPIRFDDAVVTFDGATRKIPLAGNTIYVQSVLPPPADSAKRVPKPVRPLFEAHPFPWWWLVAAAVAAIAIGLLIWWWRRRRRRPALVVVADPYERAVAEF